MSATAEPVTGRRRPMWRAALTEAVMGVAAVAGGYGLLADAEGLGLRESWLHGSPFPDYTVPGLVLLVAIGGGMLLSAALALSGSRLAPLAAVVMGAGLALWLVIETAIIGSQGPEQVALLLLCGAAALLLLHDGFARLRRP
jgi:hypothetical protein